MIMNCKSESSQAFPSSGPLEKNMNLSLDRLRKQIKGTQATVYSYIVATVKNPEGRFIQKGSAPNFQGDVISLCTCKHRMRTFPEVDRGTWIAGFSGKKAGNGENALIYLMKIEFAFESHHDLWFSEQLPESVKQAKLAHVDKFGDVFQPKSKPKDKRDEFDFEHYHPPVAGHVHAPKDWWHKDIHYTKGAGGRKPALLFGVAKYSFLWDQPTLFHSKQLHRAQRKDDLQSFLKCLK
jgi:hypothetical protein